MRFAGGIHGSGCSSGRHTQTLVMKLLTSLQFALRAATILISIYLLFLAILAIPFFQNQAIYLHSIVLTWFQDLNVPEQWGFLHNQVTPFKLTTRDGESLHAWHILPLELYRENQEMLIAETSGIVDDIKTQLSFKLLREDPDALLVLYFHGAAGTLGSGWRPPSYRALSAANAAKIHIVAIDYRGFGISTGSPSEGGLITDALTLAEWAMKEAGIPPNRIVLFAQSIGTAVAISLAHELAIKPTPILFAGIVLVAPFASVKLLTSTYSIAGTIPLLSPLAYFPRLHAFLTSLIVPKWPTKDKLAEYVKHCHTMNHQDLKYHITIIHAKDDWDIPWVHSELLFEHAVNASFPFGISDADFKEWKLRETIDLGAGGWIVQQQNSKGVLQVHITTYGLHDRIMSYPVVSLAILDAFDNGQSVVS